MHVMPRKGAPWIIAGFLIVCGSTLAAGGFELASLGGSRYYLVAGVLCLASGLLLWRGKRWGAYLYGLMLLGTLLWALNEVGFDGWALTPRILVPLMLGIWLAIPRVYRALS